MEPAHVEPCKNGGTPCAYYFQWVMANGVALVLETSNHPCLIAKVPCLRPSAVYTEFQQGGRDEVGSCPTRMNEGACK